MQVGSKTYIKYIRALVHCGPEHGVMLLTVYNFIFICKDKISCDEFSKYFTVR